MEQIAAMDLAGLAKTKAYKAFQDLSAKNLSAEQRLMNMMWQSKNSLHNRLFIPRLVFEDAILLDESKRNPEFHASLTCVMKLLEDKTNFIDTKKQFVSKKGQLISIESYSEKIGKKYPQLEEYFSEKFNIYNKQKSEVILTEIKNESNHILEPEVNPEAESALGFNENKQEISTNPSTVQLPEPVSIKASIINPNSFMASLSEESLAELDEKPKSYRPGYY